MSSVVRRCIHKESGKDFAVKIIDKFSKRGEDVKGVDIITQVRTEVNALSKLREHPNISKSVELRKVCNKFWLVRHFSLIIKILLSFFFLSLLFESILVQLFTGIISF